MKRAVAFVVALCSIGLAGNAVAVDRAGHLKPAAPAVRHFPSDFHPPRDAEWKAWLLGGFGGPRTQRSRHIPVIFVHGNETDAATWYPVATEMTKSLGYRYGDLWAISYNGVGCSNDSALFTVNNGYRGWTTTNDRLRATRCVITGDEQNVPDLRAFVDAVLKYTGAKQVDIVAHSLGVTIGRRMLWENPSYYKKIAAFVAIAGANHGTSFCPPGSERNVESCNEIAAGTAWLAQMNDGPRGRRPGKARSNEAPGPTRWMTVYDGTGDGDPGYAGPSYAQSPALVGGINCQFPDFYHNDLRVDPRIVRQYAAFLSAVEQHRAFRRCAAPPKPGPVT